MRTAWNLHRRNVRLKRGFAFGGRFIDAGRKKRGKTRGLRRRSYPYPDKGRRQKGKRSLENIKSTLLEGDMPSSLRARVF